MCTKTLPSKDQHPKGDDDTAKTQCIRRSEVMVPLNVDTRKCRQSSYVTNPEVLIVNELDSDFAVNDDPFAFRRRW